MVKKIKGFDGIRAFAVISVVLTHLGIFASMEKLGHLNSALLPMLKGSTGVQVFFILSGFLITLLLIKEHDLHGKISIKKFIIRRSLRIFPLYILFLLCATIIYLFVDDAGSWASLFYAYLYAYNFVPLHLYVGYLGHTWSLAVEEHFYLLWPTLFSILFSRRRKELAIAVIAFICVSPILHYFLFKSSLNDLYFVDRWSFIAGYNIAGGCLAAIALESGRGTGLYKEILSKNISLTIGIVLFSNSLYFHSDYWFVDQVISNYIRAGGILFIICWIYLNQNSALVNFLETPPLRYVGTISYGVYMYQGLFLSTGPSRAVNQSWPLDPAIGFVLLVVTAPLSYHFFERPILKFKASFANV